MKNYLYRLLVLLILAAFAWMVITGITDSRKAWDAAYEAVAHGEIELPIYYEGR